MSGTTATTTTTTTTTTATPSLRVAIPTPPAAAAAVDDVELLVTKAVWASRRYGVDAQFVKGKRAANGDSSSSSSSIQLSIVGGAAAGGCLLLSPTSGNDRRSSSGNAVAMAAANLSSSALPTTALQSIQIDEWCEWERAALRQPLLAEGAADNNNNKKKKQQQKIKAAIEHLEHALTNSPHLLAHTDSLADIVVVTTLGKVSELYPDETSALLPTDGSTAVSRYYRVHLKALDEARTEARRILDRLSSDYDKQEPSMIKVLQQVFGGAISQVLGDDAVADLPQYFVNKCLNPKHGDYQCNAAMKAFAFAKKKGENEFKSPQDVARAIVDAIGPDHPVVTGLEVNGPGFVLCRVSPAFLEHHLNHNLRDNGGRLDFPKISEPQVCVVDFSSPNIAKEMHVGHLRSSIIGEAVCRILEAVGHKVHRVNHVGDWGTQFGMLIQYLLEEYPEVANGGGKGDLPNITDLTQFYKSAKQRFDESPEFKEQSRLNVVKLQSGDEQCKQIWQLLCDISRAEFQKVYTRLDVTSEEYGESFYNAKIPPVIDEFAKAGLIKDEDGGAKVVFVTGIENVPLMLQKSDGGYGYDSTDMAALKYRLFELKADRIIILTDSSQSDHFKLVYQGGRDIGWVKEQRLDHIGFGTVMGEDGKRFKTRSGDTVRLVDLLDEAVNRMEASLRERIAEKKANITEDEVHQVAESIGYGAVKYYDLRRNPTSNYKFSYDQMLDTKGDTAVYLLYARVRLESIMSKAKEEHGVDVQDLIKQNEPIVLAHESERSLGLSLHVFADIIDQTLDDLFPCHVCEFVYKLSNACSDFVTQCKVLGSPEMKSRLLLCYVTATAMDQCFELLGIRQVKRI